MWRGSETSSRAPSRSGERTSPTAPGGRPAVSSAGRSTSSTSAVTVPRAALPVRSTVVLRLLSSCPATSSATFGRASKFAPTVPIGMRRSLTQEPVRERPRARFALERLDARHRLELAGEALDAGIVETQPVERPVVDSPPRRVAVLPVHAEQELPSLEHESRGGAQRLGHEVVAQRGGRRIRFRGLLFDLLVKSHFTLYTDHRQRGTPRSASREAEGPAL